MKKKLARNQPRPIDTDAWYYINDRSVDLVLVEGRNTVRLTHARLTAMLAELKPTRKRR